MFLGSNIETFICLLFLTDIITTMSHEQLENDFDKTDGKHSLVSTDDLLRLWGSKVEGQGRVGIG